MTNATTDDVIQRTIDLETELRRSGFNPGCPPGLKVDTKRIDQDICRETECGGCGRQGLLYRPYHKEANYRILASCPCGHSEEM